MFSDHSMDVMLFPKAEGCCVCTFPSLQTLSGLELAENWKRASCQKKGVVTKLIYF